MRGLFIALLCINSRAFAQQALPIPDTLSGNNFNLRMHKDSVQWFQGKITQTLSFNEYKYLGPTLILYKGDEVNISVKNEIGDTTTVHWHGLHVPAIWNGGPHSPILDGDTWKPNFTVLDNASTYWYHPHFDKKTALQAIKGAAGLIIVRDKEEAALALPRTYGVDDIPLVVQCKQLDADNQAMPRGMQDSTLMVNGAINAYVNLPAQVIRFRLLNASGERSFNFGFSQNKSFYVIGNDGGLLKKPAATTRVRLSPGERAEVLIDLSGMNTQSLYLMSYASELNVGVQGGPTMPMPPGSPPMDSPLNGIDFNILKIQVVEQNANAITSIPNSLVTLLPYEEKNASITRLINITAKDSLTMDGPFYFNDSTFDMMRIDYTIPLNSTEIWSITNKSMVAHPFHTHDVQFYILDRDGNPTPERERGRKDVVLVEPNETVRIIMKFEDHADTIVPYMYHCHVLMHEDDGMMGQFMVVPASSSSIPRLEKSAYLLYPNPSNGKAHLDLNDIGNKPEIIVDVYDSKGLHLMSMTEENSNKQSLDLDLSSLANGLYFLHINKQTYKYIKGN